MHLRDDIGFEQGGCQPSTSSKVGSIISATSIVESSSFPLFNSDFSANLRAEVGDIEPDKAIEVAQPRANRTTAPTMTGEK